MRGKAWTELHTKAVQDAAASGLLPDGRVATQARLAKLLGFSRSAITRHLGDLGLTLPLAVEVMREAGRRGGRSGSYRRRVRVAVDMLAKGKGLRP